MMMVWNIGSAKCELVRENIVTEDIINEVMELETIAEPLVDETYTGMPYHSKEWIKQLILMVAIIIVTIIITAIMQEVVLPWLEETVIPWLKGMEGWVGEIMAKLQEFGEKILEFWEMIKEWVKTAINWRSTEVVEPALFFDDVNLLNIISDDIITPNTQVVIKQTNGPSTTASIIEIFKKRYENQGDSCVMKYLQKLGPEDSILTKKFWRAVVKDQTRYIITSGWDGSLKPLPSADLPSMIAGCLKKMEEQNKAITPMTLADWVTYRYQFEFGEKDLIFPKISKILMNYEAQHPKFDGTIEVYSSPPSTHHGLYGSAAIVASTAAIAAGTAENKRTSEREHTHTGLVLLG